MTNKKQFFSYECINKMIKSRKKENPKVLWKRSFSLESGKSKSNLEFGSASKGRGETLPPSGFHLQKSHWVS